MRHVIPLLLVAVAACGGSGSIEVTDAWARPTPPVAETAALYVSFENGASSDDRLVGARLGMLVRRDGSVAVHLFSAGRRLRVRAGFG